MSTTETDQRRLRIAFFANLAMFAIGLVGWIAAESSSLLADAFDMLADASAYVLAYLAIGRSKQWQKSAAYWSAGCSSCWASA